MARTDRADTFSPWVIRAAVGLLLVVVCLWAAVFAFNAAIERSPSWIFSAEYPTGITFSGRGSEHGMRYRTASASTYEDVARAIPLAVVVEGHTLAVGQPTSPDDADLPFDMEQSPVRQGWQDFKVQAPEHILNGSIDGSGVVRRLTVTAREGRMANSAVGRVDLRAAGQRLKLPLTEEEMRESFGRPSHLRRIFSDGP